MFELTVLLILLLSNLQFSSTKRVMLLYPFAERTLHDWLPEIAVELKYNTYILLLKTLI